MSKADACWDDTRADAPPCFFVADPGGEVAVDDALRSSIETLKAALSTLEAPVERELRERLESTSADMFALMDDDGDGNVTRDEAADYGVSLPNATAHLEPFKQASHAALGAKQLQEAMKKLESAFDAVILHKTRISVRRRREAELRRFHDEVFPSLCSCLAGCEPEASETVLGAWRWQSGYHSYAAGALLGAKLHRQTLRAALWLHLLYDDAGARTARDLELLEPWMLVRGGGCRDADAMIREATDSARAWFQSAGGSSHVGVELLSQKHLDAHYDFNSPLNAAKLLRCLGSDDPVPIEGGSFAERGFVEVEARS